MAFLIILLMVFCSGFTGLVYQVTWQKYLSVLLGSHALASAIVLSLFFLFLSLGYGVLGKYSPKLGRNRLLQYGALEFFIGLYALYSPDFFAGLFQVFSHYAPANHTLDVLGCVLISAVFLAVPTFLMGGTIPVLTQGLSKDFEGSAKVHGLIYSVNTLGAFLGVVVGGFVLIEEFGLATTLTLTGDVNILLGLASLVLVKVTGHDFAGPDVVTAQKPTAGLGLLYVVSFLSGFYVFTAEKLVIYMSGLAVGSTVYSYSIVVAGFVFAIGVGSFFLTYFERRVSDKTLLLILASTIAAWIVLYFTVPQWPVWALRVRFLFQSALLNFGPFWFAVLGLFVLVLLIPVGLMGTNLPLLFALIRTRGENLSTSVGRLYAVNSLGAALGAVIGGYFSFQFLEADQVFKAVLVLLVLSSACGGFYLFKNSSHRLGLLGVSAVLALLILMLPKWPLDRFTPGLHQQSLAPQTLTATMEYVANKLKSNIIFSRFDPNTYASVVRLPDGKNMALFVNGKPDAATNGDQSTRAMAALTPISLSPTPVRNVFIAGLGAGLSTGVAASFEEVQHIDVAEISSGVIQALPLFEKFNFQLKENRHKVNLILGDAYRVLMTRPQPYDLIICEPSNPWVSGIEKLYSKEFYEVVRSKLSPGGRFVQWFPLFNVDTKTFRAILNTFQSVFPNVVVWSAGGSALTMIGGEEPLQPDFNKMNARFQEQKKIYESVKLEDWRDILFLQLLTPFQVQAVAHDVEEMNSVYKPFLEFNAGRANFAGISTDMRATLLESMPLPIPSTIDVGNLIGKAQINYLLNKKNLDEARALLGGNGSSELRLLLEVFRAATPGSATRKNLKILQEYNYLLGQHAPPVLKKDSDLYTVVGRLAEKFRHLTIIGERPKFKYLEDFIQKHCKKEECAQSRFQVVRFFARPSIVLELRKRVPDPLALPEAGDPWVDQHYAEVVRIYKDIGAYE